MRATLVCLAILYSITAPGQTASKGIPPKDDDDPPAIAELGGAMSYNFKGVSSAGPSIAIEFTPIKEWLEIEFGATESYSREPAELSLDLLFKKPFTISHKLEFMAGFGPEFNSTRVNGRTIDTWAGEAALDFMYWPFKKRRFGFYAEPAYDYTFSTGNEQSIGISAGLLISID